MQGRSWQGQDREVRAVTFVQQVTWGAGPQGGCLARWSRRKLSAHLGDDPLDRTVNRVEASYSRA
jgi:hypothetical protein